MQQLIRKYLQSIYVKCFFILAIFLFASLYPVSGWTHGINYDYNHGLGKIDIRSQSPAQSLRLTLPMLIPGDIKSGWGSQINLTWSNVWASDPAYLLDYEMLDTITGISYGFNRKLGIMIQFENRSYFGGAMDSMIQHFHSAFGIDQNGRDKVSENREIIQRFNPRTGQLLSTNAASELDNNGVGLIVNYNITPGSKFWPSANIYGIVRYGLNSPFICETSHPVDFGFGFGSAKRLSEKWYTYMSMGYTFYQPRSITAAPGVTPIEFEDRIFNGFFGLAWNYTPDFAIIVQYLYSGSAIKNLQGVDKPSHEIHMGFKWNTGYGIMEFAFTENIINMDNSPDFGMHTAWNYMF